AAMIQQVLEETRFFKVITASTGAEAIGEATRDSFDIAILESSLEDFSLRDAITVLRRNQPYLPIMVILPFGEQPLPDALKFFDVQGMLSKPLYIPDLQKQIELALTKPVNGVTPSPRAREQSQPAPPPGTATPPHPQTATPKAAPTAPAWLDDVNRAAQYLTTLTLESSAEAALLMRGQQLIAFAGQCSKADADELARVVATHWAKDGGGGQGAQVRFIRLTSGADYLVYSTLAATGVVLSMAFQAETPLGQIRKQAKRATEVMLKTPAVEAPAAAQPTPLPPPITDFPPPAEIQPASQEPILEQLLLNNSAPTAENEITEPIASVPAETVDLQARPPFLIEDGPPSIDWTAPATTPVRPRSKAGPLPDWATAAPSQPVTEPDYSAISSLFTSDDPAIANPREASEVEIEPIPDEAALTQLSNSILQLERQALVEQPPLLELAPAPLPHIRRTPHSLYDLSYTFLLIPRLSTTSLTGDLKTRLEHWLAMLADAYDWQAQSIHVELDHVEVSLACPPADSPEKIARGLMHETSDKIFAEFPRLAADHAKRPGAFWSSAYYVITPARRLAPEEVTAFVEYQRREQGG
ncbi:MAG TPA: IS200/IS605 family transposase, partial [Anaerolineales bacterium]|nr:IS200/IS605 family transposase [Anaerolineales bacterium]